MNTNAATPCPGSSDDGMSDDARALRERPLVLRQVPFQQGRRRHLVARRATGSAAPPVDRAAREPDGRAGSPDGARPPISWDTDSHKRQEVDQIEGTRSPSRLNTSSTDPGSQYRLLALCGRRWPTLVAPNVVRVEKIPFAAASWTVWQRCLPAGCSKDRRRWARRRSCGRRQDVVPKAEST